MALAELYRSPIHDLGQDVRRFVAVFVTANGSIVTDMPTYGAAYAGVGAVVEPLTAHIRNIRIEENWLPGIAKFTIEYVGPRGK